MGTSQGGAFGSAMHAAVAAGSQTGGYDSIFEAVKHMAHLRQEAFTPIPAHQTIYDRLYREYITLYDYFGRGSNDVMKRLKSLREEILTDSHGSRQRIGVPSLNEESGTHTSS